ncbi:lipid IV(A) 3-deoxy-D-manno-octulosonic acid transferase [Alkalimarinus sediminis]|uniref:3-deoxy-D-manno-octulosonic acid transferase n=1 Tax=Alkalimarinus sediminis TaxID=1632866 RepID=A0A9E8HJT8_9ALTE|nr:lipid IV(A) 3-deoxy-D-manno-octulosonic acid transferase [Alkalimarinus sediminis]UZW74056.1 lipid IV(A) 3-deoxy-D-manno-octulosonic acid transferase [Alkalimarinus sediminis]
MARYLYSLIFYLITPFILLRLLYRAWKAPAYAARWLERFAFFPSRPLNKPIWVHAVSVGETIAAAPLIKSLQQRYPDRDIVVTTMTPTGSERVRALFGDSVFHVYAPYDLPGSVKRFLRKVKPETLIIMETELWPNIVHYTARSGIPVILANARLSERSARGYQRVRFIAQPMLQALSRIVAQNAADAERFKLAGADDASVVVSGSIKFDFSIDPSLEGKSQKLREQWGVTRPVWIAASTHQGEDQPALDVHKKLLKQWPNALLIIVPRHPERFKSVYQLCSSAGYKTAKRSANDLLDETVQVLLADTMGELMLFYGAADVAFVGGSLIESGGHNPLEPAALKMPVIMGPHVFNFEAICHELSAAGGLKFVGSAELLAERVGEFFEDEVYREDVGLAASSVVEANRGALERLLNEIDYELQEYRVRHAHRKI